MTVHARPRVTIFSTGDEVVPPDTADAEAGPGARRHGVRARRPGGGRGRRAGARRHRGRRPGALEKALRDALPASDLLRDLRRLLGRRAGRDRERRGAPRRARHLVPRAGHQAGQAHPAGRCDGVPVIGLPGNPRSALVVFRLLGMPVVRLVGGCTVPPPEPSVRARLSRDLASATGRLDVVQVKVSGDGVAAPVFGLSALLSVLTAADGYIVIPEEATGLDAGSEVDVILYA